MFFGRIKHGTVPSTTFPMVKIRASDQFFGGWSSIQSCGWWCRCRLQRFLLNGPRLTMAQIPDIEGTASPRSLFGLGSFGKTKPNIKQAMRAMTSISITVTMKIARSIAYNSVTLYDISWSPSKLWISVAKLSPQLSGPRLPSDPVRHGWRTIVDPAESMARRNFRWPPGLLAMGRLINSKNDCVRPSGPAFTEIHRSWTCSW